VGGTLLKPQISLESDAAERLSESDILSYLLIGRPADDVSGLMSGAGGAGRRLEGQAAVLVLGLAANQLKQTIGRRLNLDVVEIDLGMGSSATRVRAGKYFGSRFFVSYAQDVSEARGKEVVVEYELLPHVTLEAQQREGNERERDRSSFGIFWKKEW
jgi:autotransporter translocation and assembly factor TamB